jgi:pyridoxal-phosphate dependent enzyme
MPPSSRPNEAADDLAANVLAMIGDAQKRIYGLARETPVELLSGDNRVPVTARVYLKLEHLQKTGSFKLRGATNKVPSLSDAQAAAGVVTSSTGNHGLGVATAAKHRGIDAEVFISTQVSEEKLHKIQECGARIRVVGDNTLKAELLAREAASASVRTYISPYNDPYVVAGQGRAPSVQSFAVYSRTWMPCTSSPAEEDCSVASEPIFAPYPRTPKSSAAGRRIPASCMNRSARAPHRLPGNLHALGEHRRRHGSRLNHFSVGAASHAPRHSCNRSGNSGSPALGPPPQVGNRGCRGCRRGRILQGIGRLSRQNRRNSFVWRELFARSPEVSLERPNSAHIHFSTLPCNGFRC